MNYLQLCQRARQQCGIEGDGPASVIAQQGMQKKLVDWVAEAWLYIQNLRQWDWMLARMSIALPTGQSQITLPADFRQLDTRYVNLVDGTGQYQPLSVLDFATFRNQYERAALQTQKPDAVTIAPGNAVLKFSRIADADYTLVADYWQNAVLLAANADAPLIGEQDQWAIIYRAMTYYAAHEDAPEVFQDAQRKFDAAMVGLYAVQMNDALALPEPLA
jgi:hypothetical protein